MVTFFQPFPLFLLLPVVTTAAIFMAGGLSIGVGLAVSLLSLFQWKGVFANMTEIESWIVDKAASRREEVQLIPCSCNTGTLVCDCVRPCICVSPRLCDCATVRLCVCASVRTCVCASVD